MTRIVPRHTDKEAWREYQKEWRRKNPERAKEIKKAFRERHKDRISKERSEAAKLNRPKLNELAKKWRDENPEKSAMQAVRKRLRGLDRRKDSSLRFHYNVTFEQYEAILEAQNHLCAICRKPQDTAKSKRLFVDHNHSTGLLRGLLCHRCNAGLGYFLEDPALFMRAVKYLEAFKMEITEVPWHEYAIEILNQGRWMDE